MVKEPPILMVNKEPKKTERKRRTTTDTTRKCSKTETSRKRNPVTGTSRRASSSKRTTSTTKRRLSSKKKSQPLLSEKMRWWGHYVLMGIAAVLFVVGFYYFFIRPYAYRWKPCYGMKAYGVCLPYGYQVHGFDMSHHQGKIDWALLQQTQQSPFPIRFVFMKSSEGGDFSDTTFAHNFSEAKKYGFVRGAYHFYNPKTDPVRQARFFINSVKLEPGDFPPVLDIEKKGKNMDKLRRDLKVWLKMVEDYYKVKPILYTSYKFKTRYLNDSVFNTYPYWIAHYYVDSVRYEGEWKFWQHTDVGTLPGVPKKVDLNVFNGSLEDLHKMTIP